MDILRHRAISGIATSNPEGNDVTIRANIKKLLHLFRRSSRSRYSLENLPSHILINIFGHLSVLDKACLALTCKSFHYIFKDVFEDEVFRFPRLYQLQNTDPDQFGTIRNDLLHRLQDRRMKYCAKCIMLHRREAFAQPTYHGPMMYRQFCWTEAGIVDLCPCIALTVYLRLKIIRNLLRYGQGKTITLKGRLGLLFSPVMYEGKPAFIHECEINALPYVVAKIRTVVYLGGGKNLFAATEYSVTTDNRVMPWRPNEAFRDTLYNLLWAVRASENGVLLDEIPCFFESDQGTVSSETLHTLRNLGNYSVPVDRHWLRQDRSMSPSFVRLMHGQAD
ncbi:hypothetical protein BJY04DRAFT_214863 [Aspergillus karnatakaensis]|uniref:F-box protein n=1 Tax=Aspergillus karnatakaensis TaxID=1810916 RepID=UPI003CCE1629